MTKKQNKNRSERRERAKNYESNHANSDSSRRKESIDVRIDSGESKSSSVLNKLTNSQKKPSKPSSFLEKMRARLSGGHFRMINEKLYTCTGKEALEYFKENTTLFNVYHKGYQEQMSHWPEQPVNIIIRWLKDRSASLVVADFGCGDARLAKNVRNKVFSLDLVANDPSVIACDMASTPLESSSVDVAVFCLSLMGTNFPSYIKEAIRVLKPSGWILIAEVKSRLDPENGGADPDEFIKAICDMGFTSEKKDFSNKMFILLYFKRKDAADGRKKKRTRVQWPELKPCIYKRR